MKNKINNKKIKKNNKTVCNEITAERRWEKYWF